MRKQNITLLSIVFTLLLAGLSGITPERKVSALLSLNDTRKAVLEAEKAVVSHPQTKGVWKVYFQALSQSGEERKLLEAWSRYKITFPENNNSRWIQEQIAWGVIENGNRSTSPLIRLYASLGAFMGQDARGVKVLKRALKDSNAQIRGLAVQLSSNFRDPSLQDAITALLKSERSLQVRVEVIKALGKMKIDASERDLIAILTERHSSAAEKAAATESLVHLMDSPNKRELEKLSQSNRAALRILAAQVIAQTGECADASLLVPLLQDPRAEVRANAVQAIGILRINECHGKQITQYIYPLLRDHDPLVAISAAWALTLSDAGLGLAGFEKWFNHPNKEVRHLAAGALASTGKYGSEMIQQVFEQTQDPYVKANLALALISQRKNVGQATTTLASFLEERPEKIMWDNKGSFRFLTISKMKYSPLIPNQPEAINQITRLELLNILAFMEYPKIESALRTFLKAKAWGVSGMASALLLTEGEGSALEIVEQLLHDSDLKVKIQAALILALWGSEESAVPVLQQAYSQMDKQMKERILEGLGRVGSDLSIPFLLECLQEPSQSLRIIAAASLLRCLYK